MIARTDPRVPPDGGYCEVVPDIGDVFGVAAPTHFADIAPSLLLADRLPPATSPPAWKVNVTQLCVLRSDMFDQNFSNRLP